MLCEWIVALNATTTGIYCDKVIVSFEKRKMVKAGEGHLCISDEMRLDMLRNFKPLCRQRINEMLAQFHVLVAKRGEDDLDRISEVWEIMDKNGKIPWNAITDFHAEGYTFLSNFYEAPVFFDRLTYGSNEAAFQAQKCMTEEEKIPFTEYGPGKSKGMGRRVQLRPDWEAVKVGLMEEIVRAKFTQHPELAWRLIGTGDKMLVEGNHWGDTFWGVDTRTGQGENHLGKILMKVREELKSQME